MPISFIKERPNTACVAAGVSNEVNWSQVMMAGSDSEHKSQSANGTLHNAKYAMLYS